jgi:CRISPR-associated protein Cas1
VRLRLAQARLLDDAPRRAALAALTVRAKLTAQRRLLAALAADGTGERRLHLDAIARLEALAGRLGPEAEPPPLPALLGLEGAGSAAYFAAYQSAFAPSLGFRERNRRPPRDPVNVALSLGYTLLHHEAVCAAHAAGLDPLVGVLHEPAPGRESLACDLVEPLRPHVDRLALGLFRTRELRAEHFSIDGGACRLGKAGRERFYGAWEAQAPALRRLLRLAVRGLTRELLPAEAGP